MRRRQGSFHVPLMVRVAVGPGEGALKIKTPRPHSLKRNNRSIQVHSSKGSDAGFDPAGLLHGDEQEADTLHVQDGVTKLSCVRVIF